MKAQLDTIPRYVSMIRNETNIDMQVQLLEELNLLLPEECRLTMPSLITNDYVWRAVNIIEEKWLERLDSPVIPL
jgi:hypothetical protein